MQQNIGGSATTPNSAVDRTAGSHSLAAAGQRERSATRKMAQTVAAVAWPRITSSNRHAAQDYRFEGGLLYPVDFVRQEAR